MLLGNHDEGVNRTATPNIALIPAVECVQTAQTHSTPEHQQLRKRLLHAQSSIPPPLLIFLLGRYLHHYVQ